MMSGRRHLEDELLQAKHKAKLLECAGEVKANKLERQSREHTESDIRESSLRSELTGLKGVHDEMKKKHSDSVESYKKKIDESLKETKELSSLVKSLEADTSLLKEESQGLTVDSTRLENEKNELKESMGATLANLKESQICWNVPR